VKLRSLSRFLSVFAVLGGAVLIYLALDGIWNGEIALSSSYKSLLISRQQAPGFFWGMVAFYTCTGSIALWWGIKTAREKVPNIDI
jgi:hypothetical protein